MGAIPRNKAVLSLMAASMAKSPPLDQPEKYDRPRQATLAAVAAESSKKRESQSVSQSTEANIIDLALPRSPTATNCRARILIHNGDNQHKAYEGKHTVSANPSRLLHTTDGNS
eukprot:scaffold454860_cov37-Prasinocladus_malaysianus.AAC.1